MGAILRVDDAMKEAGQIARGSGCRFGRLVDYRDLQARLGQCPGR